MNRTNTDREIKLLWMIVYILAFIPFVVSVLLSILFPQHTQPEIVVYCDNECVKPSLPPDEHLAVCAWMSYQLMNYEGNSPEGWSTNTTLNRGGIDD